MPTVQQVILNLLSGIEDPEIRMEVSRTIMYLAYVYASGKVRDDEVYDAVFDVTLTLTKLRHPELDPKEQRKIAKQLADEVMEAFRLQSMFKRTAVRVGI